LSLRMIHHRKGKEAFSEVHYKECYMYSQIGYFLDEQSGHLHANWVIINSFSYQLEVAPYLQYFLRSVKVFILYFQ